MRFWFRRGLSERESPDIPKARRDLERIRAQRSDVDALVAALVREQNLNNFTANVTIAFRGK